MHTLFSFYRSREWRALLDRIKGERLTPDGQLICEYCGKPMTRAYDIIGHHKEALTEDNVNDYTISLNPDNIALVHHRCHNYIHNKLGYKKREIFLVYGPPLAGKTSWVKSVRSDGDLVIDMDDIWQCISGCQRYVKPNCLRQIAFKIRDTLMDAVRYRLGKWNNAYIIGGYPLVSERERIQRETGARPVFVDATEAECMARLEQDGDRDPEEWAEYIREWFRRAT